MNEQQEFEEVKDNKQCEKEGGSSISSKNSIKSVNVVKSIVNIFPEINSPKSQKSKNSINDNQKSFNEMNITERMNNYASKLENKKQEYEDQFKKEVRNIKIIRMREEKQKAKEEQGPYPRHEKQFVIRKSPDEFDRQKFLPSIPYQQSLNKLQKVKLQKKNENQEQEQSSSLIEQKDNEEENVIQKQKGWRYGRSRLDLFVDINKEQSQSPSKLTISQHKKLFDSDRNPSNLFTKRKSSNNITHKQDQQESKIRSISGNQESQQTSSYFTSFMNKKRSDPTLVKSILKQQYQSPNKTDLSQLNISIIPSDQNNCSNIKRVSFLQKQQSPRLF